MKITFLRATCCRLIGVGIVLLTMLAPATHATSLPATPATRTLNHSSSLLIAPNNLLWTRWQRDTYVLVYDGESLWIGGGGGVIRWQQATQSYRRYSTVDGLPQQVVYAAAVDAAGNRWFGGDGGLSRFDTQERWTHFTTANSWLQSMMAARRPISPTINGPTTHLLIAVITAMSRLTPKAGSGTATARVSIAAPRISGRK